MSIRDINKYIIPGDLPVFDNIIDYNKSKGVII